MYMVGYKVPTTSILDDKIKTVLWLRDYSKNIKKDLSLCKSMDKNHSQ